MLYLGGIGTIWGPIIGAVIVSMLPELFRGLKELQDIAYASVLILILIFFPKGLAALPGIGRSRPRDERNRRASWRSSPSAMSPSASVGCSPTSAISLDSPGRKPCSPSSARTAPARPRCST